MVCQSIKMKHFPGNVQVRLMRVARLYPRGLAIERRERASILGSLGLNVALLCSPEILFHTRIPGHRYILCNSMKL